ncbi:MAG: SDR family NAD(P)-dependent oxidoreductase [Anaeromyxobacteraceae bacterium]
MNPAKTALDLIGKPVGVVSNALNRPSAAGRNRPLYPLNLVDAVMGDSLEDAVRNRVALITGASSGIGAVTARRIGAAGGAVVLVARGRDKLEETAEAVEDAGGSAHVYPCDLTDLDAIAEMAERVEADLGGVDILVNNAGKSIRRSLELSYDRMHDYQRTMQLNYFAPVRLMLVLLPGMRDRGFGTVINVSSIGVLTRVPRFGAYIASKAALDTLCDAWQAETHSDDVRFSTVHMSLVRTPMIEATTIYQHFPVLTPDEAADVLCEAIVRRPRRVSPPFGQIAAFADAMSPAIMDRVRSQGFQLFADSSAARGEIEAKDEQDVSVAGRVFAELTRGVHW